MNPLISIRHLRYAYKRGSKKIGILRDLSLDIFRGETVGLVGESGCGKTTLGNLLVKILVPEAGEILFEGRLLSSLQRKDLQQFRQKIQMVFQDPYGSVNPRMTVEEIIEEPLIIYNLRRPGRIDELLSLVGLNPKFRGRYPHELSGGECQRIVIARALALNPICLVLDEPIAALDVLIQSQIIDLLKKLQHKLQLTYLFISHDLAVIKYLSTRVAVMYHGEIVEMGTSEEIYKNPLHPYTQGLLASIPLPNPILERKRNRLIIQGETPSFSTPIEGCPFANRCNKALSVCFRENPQLSEPRENHSVACHLYTVTKNQLLPAEPVL